MLRTHDLTQKNLPTYLPTYLLTYLPTLRQKTILQTCDNWDTDYNSYNWEPKFMTIFVIPDNQEWQWTAFAFLAMFFINIFITVPSCSKSILLAEDLFLFSVDIFSWFQTSNPNLKSTISRKFFRFTTCFQITSFQITEMFVYQFSNHRNVCFGFFFFSSSQKLIRNPFCWLVSPPGLPGSNFVKNIARIANDVQCHSKLFGDRDKDYNEFSFSIVRIVISVSNVSSH